MFGVRVKSFENIRITLRDYVLHRTSEPGTTRRTCTTYFTNCAVLAGVVLSNLRDGSNSVDRQDQLASPVASQTSMGQPT